MKRILSLILSITLLFSLSLKTITVVASNVPIIVCDNVECEAGEQITVNVSIYNNPGFTYLEMTPKYSSELTLVQVTNGELVSDFTKGKQYVWAADEDVTTDGLLMSFTFDVASTAASGEYSVGFIVRTCGNFNEEPVEFTVQNGTVTVTAKSVAVAGVTLNKETLSLKTGESETLIAAVAPDNATNKGVAWSSEDYTVATVDDNGKVTAVKKGTTTITVTTEDGSFTDTCEVSVACSHINQTSVTERDSDCKNQGWDAYAKCDDCGQILAEDGTTEIDEIPFRPLSQQHSGGNATCTAQAICSVCNNPYGNLLSHSYTAAEKKAEALKNEGNCRDNAVYYYSCSACGKVENNSDHTFLGDKITSSHIGGTALVNQAEANHKTQTDGYTGDTKCLGCNKIIAYGQPIPANAHTPANIWSSDADHHWKECTVVGCGIVIDGSKFPHTSDKSENKATCKKKSVCDVCGVSYGELASHSYTVEDKKQEALKSEGNCCNNAVYYYSCSACGLVENNDEHTFLGDKVTTKHIGGTKLINALKADHKTQTDGYTGDTQCMGCNEIISYGQPIYAEAHIPSSNWTTDGAYHWKICTVENCGVVIDATKTEHTSDGSNAATCQQKAVCDVCNVSYGDFSDHDWNTASWEKDASGHWHKCNTAGCAEKGAFDGHTPDHQGGATEEYAIKCSICQFEIEAQLGHTHVFDKEIAEERYLMSKANCTDPAKYYKSCKCGEKGTETFAFGEALGHTEGTAWENDSTYHWHICTFEGCGVIIDVSKAEHTPDRQEATETDSVKCSVCGYEIAPILPHTHIHTPEWKFDKENHWNECACGDKANTEPHEDTDNDGKCNICEYIVSIPDVDNPETGDSRILVIVIIALGISVLCIYTLHRRKRIS